MGRFDYVKYDAHTTYMQKEFKTVFETISNAVDQALIPSRERSLVQTKLEEAYMWVGKALRNEQISRNEKTELQEERTNS